MTTTISRQGVAGTVIPDLVLAGHTAENEARTLVHEIPGSSDVVVTLRPASPSTGTLRLLFMDQQDADQARRFHLGAHVFTVVSDLAWMPAAYVPQGRIRTVQQDAARRWVLEVPYHEVTL